MLWHLEAEWAGDHASRRFAHLSWVALKYNGANVASKDRPFGVVSTMGNEKDEQVTDRSELVCGRPGMDIQTRGH